jgi:hypothetical protein
LTTIGFLVTPTLFNYLDDKQVAGMIAGEIFKNASVFSLSISVFLLIFANLLIKRGYEGYKTIRWLLLLGILLTLIGSFIIQPMMHELRETALNQGAPVMQSPYASEFSLLHRISSTLFIIEVILCGWVYWVSAQYKPMRQSIT